MIVTTKDLAERYGQTVARNLMARARISVYSKTKLVTVIIDSGNKHSKFKSQTQMMSVDTDDMVKYYTSKIDDPRYSHARKRMLITLGRWRLQDD